MFELGVRIMDQKIQSQMQSGGSAAGSATPGDAQFLLSAVNSPFFAGGGGSTFLGGQREALARSTVDAASRGTPLAGTSSNANTPGVTEGTGRKLF